MFAGAQISPLTIRFEFYSGTAHYNSDVLRDALNSKTLSIGEVANGRADMEIVGSYSENKSYIIAVGLAAKYGFKGRRN